MTVTSCKAKANRENAQKSTGPKNRRRGHEPEKGSLLIIQKPEKRSLLIIQGLNSVVTPFQ